ncbi:MAG: Hsp20/alpha crystallin family protein [Lewinellaceae bacterium]|nr:Hsp20/alpha crystallin family protein [Lewinellaceae bacterium]
MCNHSAHHAHWGHHHGGQHAGRHWKQQFAQWGYPPVNVEELDDQYQIAIYAAGYAKTDFQVKLEGDVLIISVDKPGNEQPPFYGPRRMQFKPGSFQKRFELNSKIDKEAIHAKYEEGILTVTLPKLEGFETIRKDIGIV